MRLLRASAFVLSLGILASGCESKRIEGTYADATGTIVLELHKGGTARFTDPTRSEDCTYSVATDTIPLTCPTTERIFAIGQDGSLTSPTITGALKRMP